MHSITSYLSSGSTFSKDHWIVFILQMSILVSSSTNNGIKCEYIEHAALYTIPA